MSAPQAAWAGEEPLVFEIAKEAGSGPRLPSAGVPGPAADEAIPERWRRRVAARIPQVSEPDLARHFGRLARRNH
ncbi:MAG: hypothetical protein ACP5PW_04855, partial [Candidatus Dormibacteria bacterium]